jgi:hypothetical protein
MLWMKSGKTVRFIKLMGKANIRAKKWTFLQRYSLHGVSFQKSVSTNRCEASKKQGVRNDLSSLTPTLPAYTSVEETAATIEVKMMN